MTRSLATSISARILFAMLLRHAFSFSRVAPTTRTDAADDNLSPRLRYDAGLSDLNPDRLRPDRSGSTDVSREMLRRLI